MLDLKSSNKSKPQIEVKGTVYQVTDNNDVNHDEPSPLIQEDRTSLSPKNKVVHQEGLAKADSLSDLLRS